MRISSSTADSLLRNLYHDGCTASRHRAHPEFAAEQARPLGHPGQAESAAGSIRSPSFRAEAAAIVLDGECYIFGGLLHRNLYLGRMRVLHDIAERLLHDAVEVDPQILGEKVVDVVELW